MLEPTLVVNPVALCMQHRLSPISKSSSNEASTSGGSGDGGGKSGGGDGGRGRGDGDEQPESSGDGRGGQTQGKAGILKGWEERVAYDPELPVKVAMEQVIGVGASVVGDMSSRPNWGLNELDFVFSTLVVRVLRTHLHPQFLGNEALPQSTHASDSNECMRRGGPGIACTHSFARVERTRSFARRKCTRNLACVRCALKSFEQTLKSLIVKGLVC
eukprot:1160545-Pelagomonas_calceolata.AAC.11